MKLNILISIFLSILLFGCNKESIEYAVINIQLTDSPADYDGILIDIESVAINYSNEDVEERWIDLSNFNQGIYNLLDFNNGKDTLLASSQIAAGEISQIRLKLGDHNSIIVAGESCNLEIPSGSTSGLKINLNETIEPGTEKKIWIDFNADKSIIKTGSNKYHLKPVIRAYTTNSSGSIKGIVNPKEASPLVYVISENESISTVANENGSFHIGGIPEGIYSVVFEPVDPSLNKTIDNVTVVNGECTDLGEVVLSK